MNKWRKLTVLAVILLSLPVSLFADTLFLPRASIGWAQYELELVFPASAVSTKAESNYFLAGVGGVVVVNNWYFDGSFSSSINANAEDESPTSSEFERTDIRLTVGYFLQENLSLFGGYTTGESKLNAIDGSGDTITFTSSGPFAGASYTIPLGDNAFYLSAAFALLDSDVSINFLAPPNSDISADGDGFSVSAGYNIPLQEGGGFTLKANFQRYEYDNWTSGGVVSETSSPETLLILDVSYYIEF